MLANGNEQPSSESEESLRTFEEASRELEVNREKLREVVREMDQEATDSEHRRSDRECE
jgi:hypothetical protein